MEYALATHEFVVSKQLLLLHQPSDKDKKNVDAAIVGAN